MRRRRPDIFDKLERITNNIYYVLVASMLILAVIFQEWQILGAVALVIAVMGTYEYVKAKKRGERWP